MVERTTTEIILCRGVGALVVISLVILWIICLIDERHNVIPSIYMRDALRSVAFSPFGVSLRYLLKKWETHIRNASQWGWFPWSTFLCNLCGSCIAAGIIGYSSEWGWGASFITGFLGSWTTVSSLMKELEELHYNHGKRGPMYSTIYSVASFGIAIMFIQFIRLHRH
jgi:fluoride ion exporter CrcB/FEX